MTAPSTALGDATTQTVCDVIEPTRKALHDAADRHGRHTQDRTRLVLLAADITTAEVALADAIRAGEMALILEPVTD